MDWGAADVFYVVAYGCVLHIDICNGPWRDYYFPWRFDGKVNMWHAVGEIVLLLLLRLGGAYLHIR